MAGEFLEEHLHLDWRGFGANIQAAFGSLRRSGEFADVTLACEDGEVAAHRVVLAAASTHLRALLGRWRHPHPLVIFHDIKASELRSIVDFIYTGKVTVARANLASFLKVAEKLEVKGLVGEREEVVTTDAFRPLPFSTLSEGAREEQEGGRARGRPGRAGKVVKAVRSGKGVPKAVDGDKDEDEVEGDGAKVVLKMPGGIRTILPSQGVEQEGEVEEGSEGMVGNNNEGDSEESVEEEGGQEQEEQEEVPREVQGGMELLEREDDSVDELLNSFEEDSEEDIVVEEADENGVEETYKDINRELETMVEKVVDGQRISFR